MRINNPMDMGGNPLLTGITVSDMLSGSGTKLDPLKFKGLSAVDSTGQSVSEAVTSFKAGGGVTFSDDGTAIVVSADGVRTVNGVSPADGNVQLKVSDLDGSDQLADAKSLSDHMKDGVPHVTADERKAWNAKLDASAISGLQNAEQVNALIAEKMVSVVRFKGVKNAASELDAFSSEVGDLWLVKTAGGKGSNLFEEYVCVEESGSDGARTKKFELFGLVDSDILSGIGSSVSELEKTLEGFSSNSTVKAAMDADAQALSSHVGDKVSHITAAERASWTAKAEVSQIPVNVSQLKNDYDYQTLDDLTALDNAKLDRPVSAGEDGQVLTCLKGEPVWSKVTVDPVSTSLSCRMVAIQPGWYDAQTKLVKIPNTTFPAIGMKAPAAAGGHYYPLEKDDCAIGESSVTVDMSRYLTYENTQDFAEGWAVYMASGCQNGKVIEILDTPMFFTPEDKDRIFQWDGNTNGTYIKGHFYRVDANGDATDCTPQIFRAVEPIEVLSTNLTVEPFQCYEWTVKSPVTMNMEGWSTSGEEWSTIYIRVQASGSVEGGPGITFVHPLVKGKMNFCQIKGYRGKLRVFVLDSYDE